jgi:aspartate/methionine/tyrosine aminotransferase
VAQSPQDIVEVVTVPNNPDGEMRKPFFGGNGTDAWFHDIVYYWPSLSGNDVFQLEPISAPVSLFSFTKLTGHAATRFGWALVENRTLAQAMVRWVSQVNIALSIESVYRASLLFEYLAGEGGDHFLNWMRAKMSERWTRLEAAVATQPLLSIRSRRLTQYAFIHVANSTDPDIRAACSVVGLNPVSGLDFGVPNHMRFNLAEHEVTFVEILVRITQLNFTSELI